MSMERISTVTHIKWVRPWTGNDETLYFHEVTFQNGDEGKLESNTEERPDWLEEGARMRYNIRPGKKQGESLIKVLSVFSSNEPAPEPAPARQRENSGERVINAEQPRRNDRRADSRSDSGRNQQRFGKGRLDDDPKYWDTRQKCISLTTCLNHANELVVSGVIDLKDRYELALQDFNFITHYSDLDPNKAKLLPEFQKTVPAKVKGNGKPGKKDNQVELFDQGQEGKVSGKGSGKSKGKS